MACPSFEIEVDHLAAFLFKENANDSIVELSLGGIEDNKDLFYFCLDIFSKGLVYLFGSNNKVIVNDISLEQFHIVKRKMANAGLNVNLDILSNDQPVVSTAPVHDTSTPQDLPSSSLYPRINKDDIESLPNNLPLEAYKFQIHLTENLIYAVAFSLFHKVI